MYKPINYYQNQEMDPGVPAVVEQVKNKTAEAWVAVEVQIWSPAWCRGFKDLSLQQLWLGFNPGPGDSICCGYGQKEKKEMDPTCQHLNASSFPLFT